MSIIVKGTEELTKTLSSMSQARFEAVAKVSAADIYNRGKQGGTPVSTERTRPGGPHGELRQSLSMNEIEGGASVGYTKDYAPHVEYGHVCVNGGYVEGQRYLQRNVETERPEYIRLLKENIERLV